VSGGNGAVPARVQAVEVLALNVFGIAGRSGQLVARRMVSERLTELGGHVGGCACGLCELLPYTPDVPAKLREPLRDHTTGDQLPAPVSDPEHVG